MPVVRNLTLWKLLRDYFPIKLVKTADLDPKHTYLFGYHPHGILSQGAFINFATNATGFAEMFPGVDLRCVVCCLCLCSASACVTASMFCGMMQPVDAGVQFISAVPSRVGNDGTWNAATG